MHLPGRLSISTLGDLLGSLHRERTTGLLELREVRTPAGHGVSGRIHRVHLRSGLVAAVDTAIAVPPLGEILRREGLAPREAVRRLVASIEAGDRRAAGEILESSGLLGAEAIRAGLRAQLRERLDVLFAVEDAAIGFHTARPLPHALRAAPLAPADFLHGRPRARDRERDRRRSAAEEPAPRSGPRPTREATREAPREDPLERARRLLGIPRSAGLGDVRRAFRRMAGVLHPDRLGMAAPDEQRRHAARFAELSAAYHLLVA